MAKVAPVESGDHESPQGRTFEGPFKKPIPCNTPLETYDAAYLKRKKEVGEKFFTCKSGRKLCYFTDGATDPSKEGIAVVLCLHSCMLQKYMWLQQEPFKDIFQISVDRMGHGGSSDPPQPNGDAFDYTFADLVPELVELMDALYKEWSIPAEKKFFVVGHSMGACSTIEMAACPEVRDRIEAIAPVSGPCDIWNPRLTSQDRKCSPLKNGENKGCCSGGSFYRAILNACAKQQLRSVPADPKNWDDGMEALFKSYCRGQEGGDKRAWDVVYADNFLVTQILDAHIPGSHTAKIWTTEMRRGNCALWSYDPCEIKVPCFIYTGTKEETPFGMAEIHKKLIPGSELIGWEAYGHCSIFVEHRRIIQALVKKQKVEGPPLWEKGAEAAKLAQSQ
eukprot:gnl/TRDRNA2_/TRDRNA2_161850_c0_seq1.p1 gnl/TRDRNA2_/TRDRNA2_161850_c0~~gnl/TRDRNA2_/TRDRNA2_161850_c0_seq1.p1  ORF type:complete len:392 (+),score=77.47 gnl/TRDRNA2_/TRDRNA2_161850_c0_seq1:112-1287(+)